MTAPPCDPATLGDVCAGTCGRRLHTNPRAAGRSKCANGHPHHNAHGRCSGCLDRLRTSPVHPYCPHDEGEPCDCDRHLHRRSRSKPRTAS